MTAAPPDAVVGAADLVGFVDDLRAGGLAASTAHTVALADAVATVGAGAPLYWIGRSVLGVGPDRVARYDQAFVARFGGDHAAGVPAAPDEAPPGLPMTARRAPASDVEVLAERDFGNCDRAELAAVDRLLDALVPVVPRRPRRRPDGPRRHGIDLPATIAAAARHGGEPVPVPGRRPARRARRVVLLCDVSASMDAYHQRYLRLAHGLVRRLPDAECVALGTRVTRLTPALRGRSADAALARVAARTPDAGGGTRLGDGLAEVVRWGRPGPLRGAVVVICSDGWDHGDPATTAAAMAGLARLAARVVWVNPRQASQGFAPATRCLRAAAPHVDRFVPGHSLDSLRALVGEVLA